ncbi:MAG: heme NO-binding protein, partial [Verrucomicrobia bacterium]|nr:heme NO-binding protein [Verrucomicrobiota bacterium]
MYGLVNKAVQGLIIENYGEETWDKIRMRANVDVEMFISNESYSDSMTYDLLVAASEIVNQPASELLRLLGNY